MSFRSRDRLVTKTIVLFRLADYGFSKLDQLLQAIPSTVEVFEKPNKVRFVRLKQTLSQANQVIDPVKVCAIWHACIIVIIEAFKLESV